MLLLQAPDTGRQGLKVFGRPRPQALKEKTHATPVAGSVRPGPGAARASKVRTRKPSSVSPAFRDTPRMMRGAGDGPTCPQMVECRQKFAPHQVAGAAQHHQQVRINLMVVMVVIRFLSVPAAVAFFAYLNIRNLRPICKPGITPGRRSGREIPPGSGP